MLPYAIADAAREADPLDEPSLRGRKKQLVRRTIAASALELFAEHGFDDTTVQDVAEHAGVSAATVARYFPTKESMLFSERDERIARLRVAILERPRRESPMTAVVEALAAQPPLGGDARRDLLRTRRAISRSARLRGRASALLDEWRTGIAAAVVERDGLPGDDARTLATIVVAVLDDVTARWSEGDGRSDLRADIHDAFESLDRSRRRTP